eukprot:gnl/TRDRNA2_/TRDRNA2_135305_c0_seq3.p1 gnl/TRDRNA2_/TRDRNA2_135305_c0~~gnl/TRDRNA2_/TRDRNA2_135305_c0_seq3.p1  ORF type:complete len:219 (+),score=20.39 gnl/TRDRNA2_/TRDRNA2_135305_c0_seq3:82-657(+)
MDSSIKQPMLPMVQKRPELALPTCIRRPEGPIFGTRASDVVLRRSVSSTDSTPTAPATPTAQCKRVVSVSLSVSSPNTSWLSAPSPRNGKVAVLQSPQNGVNSPAWMFAPSPVPRSRRVQFLSFENTSHDVTPYSEVYGIHPRFFNWNAWGEMEPTPHAFYAKAMAGDRAADEVGFQIRYHEPTSASTKIS